MEVTNIYLIKKLTNIHNNTSLLDLWYDISVTSNYVQIVYNKMIYDFKMMIILLNYL